MRKIVFASAMALALIACSTQRGTTSNSSQAASTKRKLAELRNEESYVLAGPTDDQTYGYDKSNPIKVGGGPTGERNYLNLLAGPNGEELLYHRSGSCCSFKTPNGFINNSGMLDAYRVYWQGSKDTLILYLNMYDKGELKIPIGLTARK